MHEQKEGTKGWESKGWAGNCQEFRTIRTLNARLLAARKESWAERGQPESAIRCLTAAWSYLYTDRHFMYSEPSTYKPSSCKHASWVQEGTRTCAINFRSERNCSLSFCLVLLTMPALSSPHLLPPPDSHSYCPLTPCPPRRKAVVLYYCTFQDHDCKIKNVFLNVLFVWKVLQTYYNTVL